MDCIDRIIQVSWRHRVFFTDDVFKRANSLLRMIVGTDEPGNPQKTLIVLDQTLATNQPGLPNEICSYFTAHNDKLNLVRPPVLVPGGEQVKNVWSHIVALHGLIDQHHIDRHSYIITVGGGALLDAVGLAAATAHRGIRHVRIPTTTLSQCDSGVGVKNGVNAFGKKNFIGTFAPPFAVINDFQLLCTLDDRDKRGGYAEAVKVACIRDVEFFDWLERSAVLLNQFEAASMRQLIRRCAELHVTHIADSGDPFEFGASRPLDFGHWAAHKLEQLSDFRLRHGEAVAIGIALDLLYSQRVGYLSAREVERVLHLLEKLGFDLFATELRLSGGGELYLFEGLQEFREHLGGQLAITFIRRIGEGFEAHEINAEAMREAIMDLESRQVRRSTQKVIIEA
jgi:3-dehydroquinate synthase